MADFFIDDAFGQLLRLTLGYNYLLHTYKYPALEFLKILANFFFQEIQVFGRAPEKFFRLDGPLNLDKEIRENKEGSGEAGRGPSWSWGP